MGNFPSNDEAVQWLEMLPDDLQTAIASDCDAPKEGSENALADLKPLFVGLPVGGIPAVVAEHAQTFIDMGRIARLRFLSWAADCSEAEGPSLFQKLAGKEVLEEGEDDTGSERQGEIKGQGGIGKVAPYFFADIMCGVRFIGPRAAAQMANADTINVIQRSAFEIQGEIMAMKHGG